MKDRIYEHKTGYIVASQVSVTYLIDNVVYEQQKRDGFVQYMTCSSNF